MTLKDLERLLRPIRMRIAGLVSRGVVTNVDASKKVQIVQLGLLDEETRDDVERFQNVGFSSAPNVGAEAVVLFVGGRRDHGIVVAVDDRRQTRPSLAPGEVAMHAFGSVIIAKADGTVLVTAAANVELVAAGNVTINGGNIILNGGSTNVAKVGSNTVGTAGPYAASTTVTDGSSTVKVP